MTPNQTKDRDHALLPIAKRFLGLETLDSRGGDSLDFAEQSVCDIRCALEAAFTAGVEVGHNAK
jgi:hypothetical protein